LNFAIHPNGKEYRGILSTHRELWDPATTRGSNGRKAVLESSVIVNRTSRPNNAWTPSVFPQLDDAPNHGRGCQDRASLEEGRSPRELYGAIEKGQCAKDVASIK
jgi:hypothetical protein